jgi:hypothetical protein
MQTAQQLAESIVQATVVTHNPSAIPQQRAEAVQFFEQARYYADAWTSCYVTIPMT